MAGCGHGDAGGFQIRIRGAGRGSRSVDHGRADARASRSRSCRRPNHSVSRLAAHSGNRRRPPCEAHRRGSDAEKMMPPVLLMIFVASLALAFILSGMEAGVFSLSRWRIRHHMRSGNQRARALYSYLENPNPFLWTILVGNTIASVIAVSLMVMFFYQYLAQWPALFIATLVASVLLFYAAFELLPKTIFRAFPNRLCMFMAPPFRFVYLLFKPVVALLMIVGGNFPQGSGA